jgi:NitT/TauT family transport system substrate-binding protein
MKRSTALGLLTAATAAPLAPRIALAEDTLIRMAMINIDSGLEPYYAQEGGFFHAAGLRAEFQQFNNGQAIATAVLGGSLDIAVSNPVALAQAHNRNVQFAIVAPAALYLSSDPTTSMMVPKNSPIAGPKDLEGKTIALNGINGIPEYCVRAWIEKNGGNASTLKFVEMNFAQMMDALGAVRVDAACVTEPFITEAKTTGRSIGLPFDACGSRFLMSVYISTPQWAAANRETVKRFQLAMAKTAAWANKNHDKTAALLTQYTKLPDATVRTMRRAPFAETWNAADAQPLIDLTAKYSNFPTFPAAELYVRGDVR